MSRVIIFLLSILSWLYYLQPHVFRRLWGNALGAALRLTGIRAGVVRQNLAIAFPTADKEMQKKQFLEAYRHLGNLVLEILLLFGPMKAFTLRFGELKGVENWRSAKEAGKGVIFLSSHVGNWETMAAVGSLHGGMDLMLVTKHLKPEWLHRSIESGRRRCGVLATYEPKTLRDVLGHLKKNGTVGFVLDQYAGPPVGVRVPVFGVPVSTSTAVAMLAKRTGAAVLPVVNYRTPDGHLVVDVRPPLEWLGDSDSACELAKNTAHYAKKVEDDIITHPDQWLWTHRRFKGDLSPLREGEWSNGRPRK